MMASQEIVALQMKGGSSLLSRRRCLDTDYRGSMNSMMNAKIQANKKEYKIILRLNDQKKWN
jgi:hypothetical protein